MLLGFLGAASPISQYIVWIIGMVCIVCLADGFLNFADFTRKGHAFNRKTLISAMMPGLMFALMFLTLVAAGVSLGMR
ncbi:hypothetical protein [Nostoc sp. MG11]|uniref:hypothetical protein n=1 Tax=Nostoc sp. MG11 TaxID=2721166 RepID=UPI001D007CB4|nr:hypothetical protein [Nostoc sp. MG11]